MNIQIFGKSKCFDTKKAERYFKERRIKYQYIDLIKVGISPGELKSVRQAVKGFSALLNESSKEYAIYHLQDLRLEKSIEEAILLHPELLNTPIVRNGKLATVGYHPEIWKTWE